MKKLQEVLKIARNEVGVKELPSNQIKYNDWYYNKTVNGDDFPWCAAFISWVMDQAGLLSIIGGKHVSCKKMYSLLRKRGQVVRYPHEGDLVFFRWTGDLSIKHIGLIEEVGTFTIMTIEGNFGDEVQWLERDILSYEYDLYFVRLDYR